ncbi:glycosyltransferase family protein [Sphingomonas sp. PB4P5]|uniref:glycosyltransferase family protein n=1 Tax=Parasphingomonas puruogangriensis TaxID=3096155 RepID=UPI002FCA4155
MKLAYVHPMPVPMPWANTVHVMRMCQSFGRAGHDVRLIVPHGGENGGRQTFDHYGVEPVFEIVRAWKRLPVPGNSWLFALAAGAHLLKARPDLVYTRNIQTAVVATRMGIETVFEAHGPPAVLGKTEMQCLTLLLRSKHLVRLTVISEALKRLFLEQIDSARLDDLLYVAHDGADADENWSPEDESAPFTAVYAGSFFAGRGVELALAIARRAPDIRFKLAGCHPDVLPEWQAKVAGIANVELIGRRPPSEVPALLASGHALLAPYQSKVGIGLDKIDIAEYFSPLKMFEYMAAGRAIVSTALPVLREVLTDGETALLRDGDNVDAWVIALRDLRDDRVLRQRIGGAARQMLIEHYTWDARARSVLSGLG